MERPFLTYKVINTDCDSYFIGANCELGFNSAFDFSKEERSFERLIILKGGPGTGKSTLMKKIADKSETEPVCFYCSSDPFSLDGVVFTSVGKRCAICDGTAPHVTEMSYPGAISEIVNLGDYWKSGLLTEQREKIIDISNRKKLCFSSAYSYLKSAADIQKAISSISEKVSDREKMAGAVHRLISKYKTEKGTWNNVYTEAFSMSGCVAFDTYFRKAKEIYYIQDAFSLSNLFLNTVDQILSGKIARYTRIVSPVNTSVLSAIFINGADILITHNNFQNIPKEGKTINMKRFLLPCANEYKNRYAFGVKCHNALLQGAAEHLTKAREHHFELEKIYVKSMNFKKLEKLPEKLFN